MRKRTESNLLVAPRLIAEYETNVGAHSCSWPSADNGRSDPTKDFDQGIGLE